MIRLPDLVTHYHSRLDPPFLNLSDLPLGHLDDVIEQLKQRKADNPEYKRVFGKRYMDFRKQTESKLRQLFEERGGKPERQSPHYFVLGECPWFSGLYPDAAMVQLDWRTLPAEQTSFTYPDSFVSMRLGPKYGLAPEPPQPYHERIFFMDELAIIAAKHGLPDSSIDGDYEGYQNRKFEKYIEVQLWSDEPVKQYLRSNR